MPTCKLCRKYYSIHAKWCPSCYTDGGHLRLITSAIELPVVGATYTDPDAGDTQVITGVNLVGDVVTLALGDGTRVDIALSELREVSLPTTLAHLEAA